MDDSCNKLVCARNKSLFDLEDIITDILLRLPMKCLMLCKSVSKNWRRLMSSPNFKRLQLLRSQENPSYVFYPYVCLCCSVLFLTKVHGETTETIPGCSRHWCKHMICSFNGLICSISYKSFFEKKVHMGIVIFNPITQEVLLLPQSRLSAEAPKIGVAFGSRMNGYKVFRFFNPSGKSQDKHHECEVYSSITGSWKGIGSVAYNPSSSQHICIDGTVYWFIKSVRNGLIIGSILAVDMEENFSVIGIPVEATLYPFLVSIEGCLSLVAKNVCDNRFDIWILQDSKEFIWVKKCTAYMHAFNIKEVNHVTALKNKILFASGRRYFFYNMCSKTWREFDWGRDFQKRVSSPLVYTESLLPCKF